MTESAIPVTSRNTQCLLDVWQNTQKAPTTPECAIATIGLLNHPGIIENMGGYAFTWVHVTEPKSSDTDLFMAAPLDEFDLEQALITVAHPHTNERIPGISIAGVAINSVRHNQLLVGNYDGETGVLQRVFFSACDGRLPLEPTDIATSYLTGGLVTEPMILLLHRSHCGIHEIVSPSRFDIPRVSTNMLVAGYDTHTMNEDFYIEGPHWNTSLPACINSPK